MSANNSRNNSFDENLSIHELSVTVNAVIWGLNGGRSIDNEMGKMEEN